MKNFLIENWNIILSIILIISIIINDLFICKNIFFTGFTPASGYGNSMSSEVKTLTLGFIQFILGISLSIIFFPFSLLTEILFGIIISIIALIPPIIYIYTDNLIFILADNLFFILSLILTYISISTKILNDLSNANINTKYYNIILIIAQIFIIIKFIITIKQTHEQKMQNIYCRIDPENPNKKINISKPYNIYSIKIAIMTLIPIFSILNLIFKFIII